MTVELYNGDCLEVMKTLNSESIDCIITDPPYGVNFKNTSYNDKEDYVFRFVFEWYKEFYRLLKNNSYLFMFVGVKTIYKWIEEGIKAGFEYKNIIATRSFNNGSVVAKNNFGFQFQPILLFSKGHGKDFNKVDFIPTSKEWLNDKRNKNPKPFTYAYPNWIKSEWCFSTAKNSLKNNHPNEKNVKLIKYFIKTSSDTNNLILDPFMGSGSTGVACLNTNRNFIGIELDENYFNIAKKRIEDVQSI